MTPGSIFCSKILPVVRIISAVLYIVRWHEAGNERRVNRGKKSSIPLPNRYKRTQPEARLLTGKLEYKSRRGWFAPAPDSRLERRLILVWREMLRKRIPICGLMFMFMLVVLVLIFILYSCMAFRPSARADFNAAPSPHPCRTPNTIHRTWTPFLTRALYIPIHHACYFSVPSSQVPALSCPNFHPKPPPHS